MKRLILAAALLASPAIAQTSRVASSPAPASALIVKGGTVLLTGVSVTSGATAGYVMVFDAATVPADGPVTPKRCIPLAPATGIEIDWRQSPLYFQQGAVVVFSSTGCFTKTASVAAFISGDFQ